MPKVVVDYIEGEPVMHEHKATHLTSEPALADLADGEGRTVAIAGTYYIYRRIGSALYRVALSLVSVVDYFLLMETGDSLLLETGDKIVLE